VSAGANVAAAREIEIGALNPTLRANLSAHLTADSGFDFFNGAYVFATPVLGGQATVALGSIFGRTTANVNGTLTASLGPFIAGRPLNIDSSVTGFGDMLPQVYLKWNEGVHNFMIYGFGDIPVGAYESRRLANLGIGHWAWGSGRGRGLHLL
jgi:hypothetical protein